MVASRLSGPLEKASVCEIAESSRYLAPVERDDCSRDEILRRPPGSPCCEGGPIIRGIEQMDDKKATWEDASVKWNRQAEDRDNRFTRLVYCLVDWIVGHVPSGKHLDFGCGPGLLCSLLAGRGFDVHGTDIAERMIEAAMQRMKGKFVAASLPKLRGPLRDCLDGTCRLVDVQGRAWEIMLAHDPDSWGGLTNIPGKPSMTDPALEGGIGLHIRCSESTSSFLSNANGIWSVRAQRQRQHRGPEEACESPSGPPAYPRTPASPTLLPSAAAELPPWRGPVRDGKSTDVGLLRKWPANGPMRFPLSKKNALRCQGS